MGDEEDLQDYLEIHFQKPSNSGGEIENIKYISRGKQLQAFFSEEIMDEDDVQSWDGFPVNLKLKNEGDVWFFDLSFSLVFSDIQLNLFTCKSVDSSEQLFLLELNIKMIFPRTSCVMNPAIVFWFDFYFSTELNKA